MAISVYGKWQKSFNLQDDEKLAYKLQNVNVSAATHILRGMHLCFLFLETRIFVVNPNFPFFKFLLKRFDNT